MAADNDNISSVFDYVARVKEITDKLRERDDDIILFRGHAREDYELKPSLFRNDNEKIRDREAESIRRIEIAHPRELAGMSTLDKLVMLQHYEFPTRLLDFSFNPLVGLFFASNSRQHEQDDGAVIICRVPQNEIKPFDSGRVKALAAVALCSNQQKDRLLHCDKNKLSEAINSELMNAYHSNAALVRTLDSYEDYCIEELKDDFMNFIPKEVGGKFDMHDLVDFFTPVFVESKQLNPRIVAQKGAFLLFGLSDEFPESIQREKIIIPAKNKAAIMKELEQFGIDDSIMFPGFEHFLLSLREKMKRGE